MAEQIAIGESVTVEVTRAQPSFGFPDVSIPASESATSASTASTQAATTSGDLVFIIIGLIVGVAFA